MSETEYVEGLNDVVAIGFADFEAASVAYEQIGDPTMAELVAFLEREIAIGREFRDGLEALDPPDSIADVHRVIDDAMDRELAAAEGLVAVADTVGSLEEAEQTPEFAEYEAAHADEPRICLEVQAKLDNLAATSAALRDVPWMSVLRLAVRAALPCDEIASRVNALIAK